MNDFLVHVYENVSWVCYFLIGWKTADWLRAKRRKRATIIVDTENEDMVCKNTPKGWRCTRTRDHEGSCALTPNNAPLRFLRRNENGQLQRLVSDGHSAYWISAEKPSRYWYVWQAIAQARGI